MRQGNASCGKKFYITIAKESSRVEVWSLLWLDENWFNIFPGECLVARQLIELAGGSIPPSTNAVECCVFGSCSLNK